MIESLTEKLVARQNLDASELSIAARALAAPAGVSDDAKVAFLAAFAAKGETPEEIAAFATAFRGMARDPQVSDWAPRALDVVGTGGDHAGGFNISSLVTLTLACAGVPVMKHGNRGITSKCGSADLLSALGVNLEAPAEKNRRALEQLGFCFFFAPAYHPAFKHVAPARKALAARGQRTVFNLLGPLINPGLPAHSLVGVFSSAIVPKMAATLEQLGSTAGLVAHGAIAADRGIDEMTTATDNHVQGLGRLKTVAGKWSPADLGFTSSPFTDLVGGDVAANLAITETILAGRGPSGLVDTVVLNVAAGMWITGRTSQIKDGIAQARELLLGGAVKQKIAATREFYLS